MPAARSQEQIVARLREVHADGKDLLAGQEEALLPALDFDHARPFLPSTVRRNRWRQQRDHESRARTYQVLAISEILNHRAAQARHAVAALAELAWLLGRDDVTAAMDTAGWLSCGAPRVKAFTDGFGWRFADTVEDLESRHMLIRMAAGQRCHPDGCRRGCADRHPASGQRGAAPTPRTPAHPKRRSTPPPSKNA
ncbi:hypothetical protein O7627_33410 [Solwaraspora sp. WMMD1047]|uniref:hypothetical protein n=1 Tax=Solwaraspora sp. WMMD1047 TaxID=3016102 RepID=UPI0024166DA0|nr:hypothetical protein [Solwaraspora sp. WMMD1047]MDG4834165.1 hypothetical protein [Solwaraspora sp. WMMD1047]